ncbi:hypothetical protein JCM8547_001996 [Rhodosporidiobolus lusitaniae]
MHFTTLAAALASVGVTLAQSTGPTIVTPSALYACQTALISWSGGTAPYRVRVFPQGQVSGEVLATIDDQPTSDTSFSWQVNLPAGTGITLVVTDNNGLYGNTAPVTVQPGDTGCLSSSVSGVVTGGSSTVSQASTAVSIASSTAASASSSVSSVASSAASSAASVSSSAASAASSAASSASSAASSASSSVASRTASGTTAPSASASATGAASAVKVGSALALVAGAVAALA